MDTAPLAAATNSILSSNVLFALIGGAVVGVGALISVAGSDESGMIGTSRLGYALAADGLFPRLFARVHPRFKTPYMGIIIQSITALVASIIGDLGSLISVSVLFMSIAYLATSASIIAFRRKGLRPIFHVGGGLLIPVLGVVFSIYLISQCTLSQLAIGALLFLIGVPIYIKYSPKKEIAELKNALLSRETAVKRLREQEHVFLAHVLHHLKKIYRKALRKEQPEIT